MYIVSYLPIYSCYLYTNKTVITRMRFRELFLRCCFYFHQTQWDHTSAMTYQIAADTSTVCSITPGPRKTQYQNFALLSFVRETTGHRWILLIRGQQWGQRTVEDVLLQYKTSAKIWQQSKNKTWHLQAASTFINPLCLRDAIWRHPTITWTHVDL